MLKIVDECLDLCYKFNKYERCMVSVARRFHLKSCLKKTFVFIKRLHGGGQRRRELSNPETF